MNIRNRKRAAQLFAAAATAMACNTPGPVDEHWGESSRHTRAEMIANPEAGTNSAGPIEGLDSLSAEITGHNYELDATRVRESRDDEVFLIRQP